MKHPVRFAPLFRHLLLPLLFGSLLSSHAAADTLDTLKTSASNTQKQCQMLLHHDAEDYVDCVDALLRAHPKHDATRLGTAYFGWIGALNSARMSFPGANEAADRYLRQFRKTQKILKISDATLCSSVPGNCTQRTARMLQMEALPALKAEVFDGGHAH